MSIVEIEAAISKLPPDELSELMSWIERYHQQIWDKQIADDLESGRLDSVLAEVELNAQNGTLTELLLKSPIVGSGIDLTRSKDIG